MTIRLSIIDYRLTAAITITIVTKTLTSLSFSHHRYSFLRNVNEKEARIVIA
jgi:hypothetical protein